MTDADARLDALERRVQHLEDHLAILQVLHGYGLAVDSGQPEAVADAWTPEGVYDVDVTAMRGHEQLAAMVRSRAHQSWIHGGCGHVLSAPQVRVDGDAAVATCYSQLVSHDPDGGGFRVSRLSANRWELVRTEAGWKVATRTNRLLDGRAEARDLLASGAAET